MNIDHGTRYWRKASRSGGSGGNCVEVAAAGSQVAVRDSKNPSGPALAVNPGEWTAFARAVRAMSVNPQ